MSDTRKESEEMQFWNNKMTLTTRKAESRLV